MKNEPHTPAESGAPNPVLWLAVGLPVVAVAASLATLGIAMTNPEPELPEQYHWEGVGLERDAARAQRAAALGVSAEIDAAASDGVCRVRLTSAGEAPRGLVLTITHATQPALDRRLELALTAERGDGAARYLAQCRPLPAARWRLELTDRDRTWSVRQSAAGALARITLHAAGGP